MVKSAPVPFIKVTLWAVLFVPTTCCPNLSPTAVKARPCPTTLPVSPIDWGLLAALSVILKVVNDWPKAYCPLKVIFTTQLAKGANDPPHVIDPKLKAGPFVSWNPVMFKGALPMLVTVIGNGGLIVFAAP